MYLIEINCMLEILRRFTPGPEFLYFAISALTEIVSAISRSFSIFRFK